MNNGQLNVVSMQVVTQLVTQDPAVSAAATVDAAGQPDGLFAGVLNGIQHVAHGNTEPDSVQAGPAGLKSGRNRLIHVAVAKTASADLLAQLNVSPGIMTAPGPAATKQEVAPKSLVDTETVPVLNESTDAAAQMVMAAYLQAGRIPDAASIALAAVGQQNVATIQPQPSDLVSSGSTSLSQTVTGSLPVSGAAAPVQIVIDKETMPVSVPRHVSLDSLSRVSNLAALPVDDQQNVTSASEQAPTLTSADTRRQQAEQAVAQTMQAPHVISSVQPGPVKESSTASSSQPAVSDRMSEVSSPAIVSVDKLQNGAGAAAASPDTARVEQTTAAPVQTTLAETSPAPVPTLKVEQSSTYESSTAHMSSPESKVEMQLPQPQPVTAQVAAAAVAVNRSTEVVHEERGGKQRATLEQQVEKVRANNEPGSTNDVKSVLLSAVSDSESALGSDTSDGSKNGQGQHDSTPDNQMLAQQMRGQFSTDHQKVAALSGRSVLAEPVRQGLSEQVMQQINERLAQHDVKPGNQQITLTLSPDSLGELKMNLNLQGQKLSVEIMTDSRTVRDAIVQHTDALKESLARQNITMESFDVTSGGKGSDYQGQNQNAWRELAKQQQQQQAWASPRGYRVAQADLPSSQAYQRQQGQPMLDIHY